MKSKAIAAFALVIVIVILCISFAYRAEWWAFIDVFCIFMATFLHLLASMQPSALKATANSIDFIAMIFLICGFIAFIGEAIGFFCLNN